MTFIASPNHSARGNAPVRLVAIHTAEGSTTVTGLGNYFARSSVQASSHTGIDDREMAQYVAYDRAAWTLRNGNAISDNCELCGFAKWTRAEWLGHMTMLRLAAAWIRERCIARKVPIVKISPADVAAGRSGVIGHIDWTLGAKDGSHSDPGPNFPWDIVMAMANQNAPAAAPLQEDDLPTPLDVWAHPIADPYTPQNDYQPAFAMLGWAATHAAHANEAAIRAEAAAARVEKKVDALIAKLDAP